MTAHYFEIEKDLGKAPLGYVWVGRDRLSGLPVVVKKIPLSAIGGGNNGWARHIEEIRTLSRLSLPQIATVLEVGEEGDQLVMVTEKPQGRPLSSVKEDRSRVGSEDLRRWVLPIAEALAVAHDAGILHRQVHEDLIVVDDTGMPVLTGFGLTVDRRVNQDRMPPEILATGSATQLSDQFLLGAMVARLAASSDPIPGLDDVISRATADDPNQRFPDILEMMEALGQAFDAAAAAVPGKRVEDRALPGEQPPLDKTQVLPVADEVSPVVQDLHARRPSKNRGVFLASSVAAAVILVVGLGWVVVGRTGAPDPVGPSVRAGTQPAEGPLAFVGELLSEGRLHEAVQRLERLLDDDRLSDPTPALDALGTIRLQQGMSDEASGLFERALTHRAEEGLYYKLSLAQASAGKDDQALRTLNEGLRLFPESERLQEARFHLGGV
jgi:serine/threonine-protein kinase